MKKIAVTEDKLGGKWPMLTTLFLTAIAAITGVYIYIYVCVCVSVCVCVRACV